MADSIPTTVLIPLHLPPDEGLALAQFVKRTTFDDCVKKSAGFVWYSGRTEGDVMWSAVRILQAALAAAGFAPR
jgi:hypothetical protein